MANVKHETETVKNSYYKMRKAYAQLSISNLENQFDEHDELIDSLLKDYFQARVEWERAIAEEVKLQIEHEARKWF